VKSEARFILPLDYFVEEDRGPELIALCVRENPEDWRLLSYEMLPAVGLGMTEVGKVEKR